MLDKIHRPEGLVTVTAVTREDGKKLSTQDAVDKRIIIPELVDSSWSLDKTEVPLGQNLFVDIGRQYMMYCLGGQSPIANYICSQYSVGTGDPGIYAPNVTDVALIAPIPLASVSNATLKAIDGVDYPAPFIARFQFTIAASDANGYLITELGLFSGDGNLICRKTTTGINKSSSYTLSLSWRVRG